MITLVKNITTLYIDDTSVRVLVSSGKQVKKCAYLELEPGMVRGNVVIREQELADKIKQMLKAENVDTGKIVLGLSGLHCLTRPILFPELPKPMIGEAVMREAKRVLPVPLDQLYLLWQTVPGPRGKTQVFVVGIPCRTLDSIIRTVRLAGLRATMVGLKPLVLAEMAKVATAIIVDVQPTEFDIVIMAGGLPQPVRTVPFPTEVQTWQQRLRIIADDLDRTIKFFNANNPDMALASGVSVFVSGQLVNEPEMCDELSKAVGFSVAPLPLPALKHSERAGGVKYLTNMALAMKETSSAKKAGLSVAYLDVLPAVYKPKPISWYRVAALPAAVVCLLVLAFMVTMIQNASADTDVIRTQVNSATSLLAQKTAQKQKLTDSVAQLQKQVKQAQTLRDSLNRAVVSLKKQSDAANDELKTTVSVLTPEVSVKTISYSGKGFNVNGSAASEADFLSYVGALNDSRKFTDVTVANITENDDGTLTFTAALKIGGN